MKILILDDDLYRLAEFKKRIEEKGWKGDLVSTSAEAKKKLFQEKYDLIFLDHDLGDLIFVDSELEDTGAGVARFMLEHSIFPDMVVIHSLNEAGAKNIEYILSPHTDTYRIPFAWIRDVFHFHIR